MVLATLVAICVLAIEGLDLLAHIERQRALPWIDGACSAILVVDFIWRLRRSPHAREFTRRNWFDLVGSIPFGLLPVGPLLNVTRLLRLVRLASLGRRLLRGLEFPLPSAILGYLGAVTGSVWFASAMVFYLFERERNASVHSPGDALWWSIVTLSTVGYGDVYPVTVAGRIVAAITMASGVGVLGTFAGTIATLFVDLREQGRRGLRSYVMNDHLLVLGWNPKAAAAIDEFLADPRTRDARVVIVANLETTPLERPGVRFVKGVPHRRDVLERASAQSATSAMVVANDARDPRCDDATALAVMALKRINPTARVSAELVDPENREHLEAAGCHAIVDVTSLSANLLARGLQDAGVERLLGELITSNAGSEVYRVPVPREFHGRSYADMAHAMIDRGAVLLGLVRVEASTAVLVNPAPTTVLSPGDEAYVVSADPIDS